MKRSALCVGAGLVLGLVMSSRPAGADATWTAAGTCQWSEAENFDVGFTGEIDNNATTGVEHRVSCGLDTPGHTGASTTDDLTVYFYDGNSGTGMEDAVYCNIYSCNMKGDVCTNEGTRYSCSTSGGCTSPSVSSYTGDGWLSFTNLDQALWSALNLTCAVPTDEGTASRLKRMLLTY